MLYLSSDDPSPDQNVIPVAVLRARGPFWVFFYLFKFWWYNPIVKFLDGSETYYRPVTHLFFVFKKLSVFININSNLILYMTQMQFTNISQILLLSFKILQHFSYAWFYESLSMCPDWQVKTTDLRSSLDDKI